MYESGTNPVIPSFSAIDHPSANCSLKTFNTSPAQNDNSLNSGSPSKSYKALACLPTGKENDTVPTGVLSPVLGVFGEGEDGGDS